MAEAASSISRTTRYRLRKESYAATLTDASCQVEPMEVYCDFDAAEIMLHENVTSLSTTPQPRPVEYNTFSEDFGYYEDDRDLISEVDSDEELEQLQHCGDDAIIAQLTMAHGNNYVNETPSSSTSLLYDGSQLTSSSSSTLIMKYAVKHNLSVDALGDLLQLLKLHCPNPNSLSSSVYLFRKQFNVYTPKFTVHHFCSDCFMAVEVGLKNCPNLMCKKEFTGRGFQLSFLELCIEEQLQNLLKRDKIYEMINEKSKRSCPSDIDIFTDICNSKLYWELRSVIGTNGDFLTLSLNTDGIPVFKSSNYSFWPVYLTINELPFILRHGKEYRVLAGLWYGIEKPNMKLFLKPIATALTKLAKEGFLVTLPTGDQFTCKAFLLCFTSDLPAKALVLNFVQFNGYWGCSRCLQKGERVKCFESTGSTQTYPFIEDDPCGPSRTHDETLEHASVALESGSSNVCGVKGTSWLATIPHFNVIRGSSVDYMHCVLLGVCRQMLKLWLEPKFRHNSWYIGNRTQEIDVRLLAIKPPLEIRRTPRSVSTRKYWKAHELRAWLFHYSPVVLFDLLPSFYYQHHLLLVEGIYILSKDTVTSVDVQQASQLLKHYCFMMLPLYGECHMSANVHGLLHLPKAVEDLGPLWAHSCFPYENANGELLKLFHGSKSVEKQVVKKIGDLQMLADVAKSTLESESHEMDFYLKMNNSLRQNQIKSTKLINSRIGIGNEKCGTLTQSEQTLMGNSHLQLQFAHVHLLDKNRVIHAGDFTRALKRVDSCVIYKKQDENNKHSCGLLKKIVMLDNKCFAIINPLKEASVHLCNDQVTNSKFDEHFKAFDNPQAHENIVLIPISDILDKCIYIDTIYDHVYVNM